MPLETDAGEARVRDVFEFVEDDCELRDRPAAARSPRRRLVPAPARAPRPERGEPRRAGHRGAAAQQPTIRVDLDRVEKLIDLVANW
jgi:chemotaxis protein histidine kinase CheA